MVYGLCRALLRDADDADDATQSVFIAAYTSLLGGSVVREPAAWLATIARNECSARAKARMREPLPLFETDLALAPGPEIELDRKHAVEELRASIADLPEKQREAVVLRDLYGLKYTEVGAALGVSVASVESLLFRARRSLRGSLKPLATGALTVPVAVREGIARALPEFATGVTARGGAGGGALGLGLLAKFAGGPAAVKATAGIAAAVAAGSIAIAGAGSGDPPRSTKEAAAGVVVPRLRAAAEHRALRAERADVAFGSNGAAAASASEWGGHDGSGREQEESDAAGSRGRRSDAPSASVSAGREADNNSGRGSSEVHDVSVAHEGANEHADDREIANEGPASEDDRFVSGSSSSGSGSESDGPGSSGPSEEHALELEPSDGGSGGSSGSGGGEADDVQASEPITPS